MKQLYTRFTSKLLVIFCLLVTFTSQAQPPATHLKFDNNNYVELRTGALNGAYNLAQPFTIEFWLKVSDYNQNIVFSRQIRIVPNALTFFKIYTQNGNIYAGYDGLNTTISSFFPVNEWHHVAVTYDQFAGGGLVFVIDGVSQGYQQVAFNPYFVFSKPAIIGGIRIGDGDTVAPSFKGEIDEFRFWNTALDPTDIQYRKDCEISNPAQFLDLQDYYNFNQIFYGFNNYGSDTSYGTFVNSLVNGVGITPARLYNFNLIEPDSNWVAGSPVGSGGCCIPSAPMPFVNDQFFCNAATAGNLTAIGTALQFYDSLAATTPMPPTQAIASGIYYVTQSSTGVASCKRAFRVTIDAPPQAPTGLATQAFCSGATLATLQNTGNAVKWYAAASAGTMSLS